VVVVADALGIIETFDLALAGVKGGGGSSSGTLKAVRSKDAISEIKNLQMELKSKKVRVLYAEDVVFFRKHVSKVLNDAGVDVTTVEDGAKALRELENVAPGTYNLILSDIEMPNMTGLELAREIKKRESLKSIPLIALTTRFRDKDVAEGKAAGFDVYLEKLNPEKLLQAVEALMGSLGEKGVGL
jgi:CheY-like chemotaxis protein